MGNNYSSDNLNNLVSYGNTASVSNTTVTYWPVDNVYDYYRTYYYPTYFPLVQYEESKVDKAFKVVKKLIDMKLLKSELTVGKFVELVTEISKDL